MSFDQLAIHGQAAAWAGRAQSSTQPIASSIIWGDVDKLPLPPPPPKMADLVAGFGGRKARFQKHPGQMLRTWDPIAQTFVTFAHERNYHVFLLVRFSPQVRALEVAPKPLSYKRGAVTFTAKADLKWISHVGVTHYLWLKYEWTTEERARHEHFAATHKVAIVLMTWRELDRSRTLVDNLASARQLMTATAHAGVDLNCVARAIYAHLARLDQCSRGELGAELTCEGCVGCAEHLDATLFHLHALGSIHIGLAEHAYGDDTLIVRR